ncbi:MAG TPA: hypothetical protein VNE62_03960 [Actinomycetota bacterium]|nr:hypothetical protein [Actinomycetota bacterium]
MSISNFDLQALFAALDAERQARSLSWAGLTREINALFGDVPCHPIATSTITSLKGKPEVIGNAALQMLVWLERTPESFIPGLGTQVKRDQVLSRLSPDQILRFDTREIFLAMEAARTERGVSWRQVAEEIGGVTAAQLTRLGKGAGVGVVAAGRIAQWLGRPVASFTVASSL